MAEGSMDSRSPGSSSPARSSSSPAASPGVLERAERPILAALLFYFVWNSLYYFPYIVDDTFISLRYASHLLEGQGLVYNLGEYVEGFSNFLWVMIESLILALGLPAVTTIKCVSLGAGITTIVLSYRLARRVFAGQERAALKCLLGVGLLALNSSLAVWSQAGLETVFLSMLVVAMCLRFEIELKRQNPFPWSAVLFGLAWLTRPEVPIYSLYFLIRRLQLLHQRPRSAADLWWIATIVAIVLPYEAWGLWYFGKLLPTTHVAKVGEPALQRYALDRLLRQPEVVEFFTRQGWGLPGLIALGGIGAVVARKGLNSALWLIPACGFVFVLYARGDWMPRNRYFVPFLPILFLLVGYGLAELLRRLQNARAAHLAACLLLAGLLVDYTWVQMFAGEPKAEADREHRESKLPEQARGFWFLEVPGRLSLDEFPLENSALFMLSNLPEGETLVLRDIGFPGYMSMNPIWDTAGLVTRTAALARRDHSEEMQQEMFDELMRIRPGALRLLLPKNRPRHINRRIHRWLENDPEASGLYERVRPRGPLLESTALVVYLRRDLEEVDFEARLREAVERLPEYADRAEARLAGLVERTRKGKGRQ